MRRPEENAAALDAYYVALDTLLGPALAPAAREIVMIVTAPGRTSDAAGGGLELRGESVGAGTPVAARATDVAPTILYALGVPISRSLAGAPLTSLFDPAFVGRYAIRYVSDYGRPSVRGTARQGQPLDQEMIDRLRSLGYVR